MSVILDALKRVQKETREHAGAPAPASNPETFDSSDAMLRRLVSDRQRRYSVHDVTPVVWVVGAAVVVLALIAVGLYWFSPRAQPLSPNQQPLLADLLSGGDEGVTPSPQLDLGPGAELDPGAAVGAVPGGEIESIQGTTPTPIAGPDLSDLSTGLAGGSEPVIDSTNELEPPIPTANAGTDSSGDAEGGFLKITSSPAAAAPPREIAVQAPVTPQLPMTGDTTGPTPRTTVPPRLLDPGVRAAFADGVRFQKAGEHAEAERAYARALKLDPQNAKVNANLGVLYESQGMFGLAQQHLRVSLAVEPDNATAHNNLGVVLYSEGNYDGALVEFKRTLALDPQMIDAYTNMGLIYTRWGDHDRAEDIFLQALNINPNHSLTYYNLGLVSEERGDIANAVERYRSFLSLDANRHPEIVSYLGPHLSWLTRRAGRGTSQ